MKFDNNVFSTIQNIYKLLNLFITVDYCELFFFDWQMNFSSFFEIHSKKTFLTLSNK